MPEPVLEVRDLTVAFQRREGLHDALSKVSLRIERGEILGVVGESGCGKSLTALSVMRLLPQNAHIVAGSIRVAGSEVTALDEAGLRRLRGSSVSMIFQEPMVALNPLMSAGRQIEESIRAHMDLPKGRRKERVIELLGAVGVPDPAARSRQFPFELSGGLRQRVMIAVALACSPKLVIADEPTTALDVTIQAQILELLKDVRQRFGTSILFITHDLGVIADVADRVAVMYAGHVVETAAVDELFDHPCHPYTEGLLASVPELTGPIAERLPSIPGRVPPLGRVPAACPFQDRCPRVTEICRRERPPLDEVRPDHAAACWHPRQIEVPV